MDNYAIVVQLMEKPYAVQKAIFLNIIGTDTFWIYKILDHPTGMDESKLATVIAMFDNYATLQAATLTWPVNDTCSTQEHN